MIMNVEVAIIGNSFSRQIIKPRNILYFVTGNMSLTLPANLDYTIKENIVYNFPK